MTLHQVVNNPGAVELRKFGLLTGTIVATLFGSLLPWLFGYEWPTWPWVVTGILWLWALAIPETLFIVYKYWMKFGLIAGWINTRIILGLLFYFVFFPAGMLMRIFGKDPMTRKLDSTSKSYRILSQPIEKDHVENPY